MKTSIHFLSYLTEIFVEWEMFQTKVGEKIKTHFMLINLFPSKIVHLWDVVEKYGTGRQQTTK